MSRPDVSIVVCTYNRATSLGLTLDSLDAQVTPPGLTWELILVDNNSIDGTRDVIERFVTTTRIPVRSRFVGTQGLSHARNAGLQESRGAIVGFTDDDVTAAPDWVARMTAAFDEADADIIGGRILPAWAARPPRWLADRSVRGALAIMEHDARVDVLSADGSPCVWGANMAFRRAVFDKVGHFDPRRGLVGARRYGGEDTDLVRRALAAGGRAVYDPAVVVWHRIERGRMRVGHLSRVYFQGAEGEARVRAGTGGMTRPGIPAGAYRRIVRRFADWLAAVTLRRPDHVRRWLDCCRDLGAIWGGYKSRLDARRIPRGG